MTHLIENLNQSLTGFTDVTDLRLRFDEAYGAYRMEMILSNAAFQRIALVCRDVSSLQIAGFGGGLSQVPCLRANDISEQQLDCTKLRFADVEGNGISFDCVGASIDLC